MRSVVVAAAAGAANSDGGNDNGNKFRTASESEFINPISSKAYKGDDRF